MQDSTTALRVPALVPVADLVSHSLLLVHCQGAEGGEEPGGHVAGRVAGTRGGHGSDACTAGRGERVLQGSEEGRGQDLVSGLVSVCVCVCVCDTERRPTVCPAPSLPCLW